MDLQDRELDALIESALQQGGNIPSQQKQLVWERLSRQAMTQTVLPAKSPQKQLLERLMIVGVECWKTFSTFAIEEDRYERARMNRYMLRYHGIRPTGDMAMQFLEPIRLSV